MPFVIDNPNKNDVFTRLVVESYLLTVYYRQDHCGISQIGDEKADQEEKDYDELLLSTIKMQAELRMASPIIIHGNYDPRHHHFQDREKGLLHQHIGFAVRIDYPEAIRAIIMAFIQIQAQAEPQWMLRKNKYESYGIRNVCSTKLISDPESILESLDRLKWFWKDSMQRSSACLWLSKKTIQNKACQETTQDIPSLIDIQKQVQMMLDQVSIDRTQKMEAVSNIKQATQNIYVFLLIFVLLISFKKLWIKNENKPSQVRKNG